MSLKKQLVGHWKLESTECKDSSPYDNHGDNGGANGGASETAGRVGGALNFTTADVDHIDLGTPSHLKLTNKFTIALWVRDDGDDGNRHRLFEWDDGGGLTYGIRLSIDWSAGTELRFGAGDGLTGDFIGDNDFNPYIGVWTHIAVTYDNGSTTMYVNGDQVDSGTLPSPVDYSGASTGLTISSDDASGATHSGDIDDVRFYNRVLSQSEVRGLVQMQSNREQQIDTSRGVMEI